MNLQILSLIFISLISAESTKDLKKSNWWWSAPRTPVAPVSDPLGDPTEPESSSPYATSSWSRRYRTFHSRYDY